MMAVIGKTFTAALFGLSFISFSYAAEYELEVTPDRSQITEEESVSLKFKVSSSEATMNVQSISYDSPDFVELNTFQSSFMQTLYENGSFSLKNIKQITKVLRPRKKGKFQINNIHIMVNGKKVTHPPIDIEVAAAGAGTPLPRGSAKRQGIVRGTNNRSGAPLLLKAEVNKAKVFRGEQVIVSYYAYQRSLLKNIEITKFPTLEGFLREELEMPILKRRAKKEPVIHQGIPYQKELLVRYAAYPLKVGKLRIDPMRLKAHYFSQSGSVDDDLDDPFFSFSRSLFPKVTEKSSAPIEVEVLPLPIAGKPQDFSGAVGEYSMTAAVDQYEVNAGEPITLKLKIEGRGNVSSIESPILSLPSSMDLYDTKGVTNRGLGGIGEKVFEYLIIPQAEGDYSIPSIEFAYFDPKTESYKTIKTDPFQIKVNPGKPGSTASQTAPPLGVTGTQQDPKNEDIIRDAQLSTFGKTLWIVKKYLNILGLLLLLIAGIILMKKLFQKEKPKKQNQKKSMKELLEKVELLKSKINEIQSKDGIQTHYKELEAILFDFLTEKFKFSVRSHSREELKTILFVEHQLDESKWTPFKEVAENAERVQFSSISVESELKSARAQLEEDLEKSRKWMLSF